VGQADNGGFYDYIPEDPEGAGVISNMADGADAVNVALGGTDEALAEAGVLAVCAKVEVSLAQVAEAKGMGADGEGWQVARHCRV
jgi:hypothetical protein